MADRFVVYTLQEAQKFDPSGEWTEHLDEDYDYTGFLVDTKTDEIVFSDSMESEDANFRRDLRPLVKLLNQVDRVAQGSTND